MRMSDAVRFQTWRWVDPPGEIIRLLAGFVSQYFFIWNLQLCEIAESAETNVREGECISIVNSNIQFHSSRRVEMNGITKSPSSANVTPFWTYEKNKVEPVSAKFQLPGVIYLLHLDLWWNDISCTWRGMSDVLQSGEQRPVRRISYFRVHT